jgi:dolichol kinase
VSEDVDRLEFKRQMIHLLNGIAITAAVYFLKPVYGLWILVPLILALFLLHAVPKMKPDLTIANHLMYHFERRKDIREFPFKGAIFYGYGIMFPIILLDTNYACAVIIILSVGDSVSNLVGRRFGRIRILDKSLEGTLAFFFSAWLVASVFVDPTYAAVMGLVASVIELFSFADDNVTIPLGLSLLALYL